MFRHYLITAARNFAHHKLYSFINIVGLAVGLACAILIALLQQPCGRKAVNPATQDREMPRDGADTTLPAMLIEPAVGSTSLASMKTASIWPLSTLMEGICAIC